MDEQPTPNDKPPDPPPLLQQNISGHDSRIQGGNIIRGDAVFNSLPPHGAVFNGPVTIYNINPEAQPLSNVPSPTTGFPLITDKKYVALRAIKMHYIKL